jgi:bis(5'-nucleosyl)-tetraphosphatase (symmetrical)
MAIYAIGDIQGCYDSLQRLLEKLDYSPESDQLWFVGDLVNRGRKSLKTVRFVKSLGDSAITVLGNHDISLIAMHYGVIAKSTSLKKLLNSKHSDELVDWLRHRPVLHVDESLGVCMAHAGISPQWNLDEAIFHAHEIETQLRGNDVKEWLKNVYGNKPNIWSDDLQSYERHRYILNAFMRMRYCNNKDGSLDFKLNGVPKIKKSSTTKKVPWFMWKDRKAIPLQIIFGHWSSLGYYHDDNVIALDTGCVWGRQLTALRVDDEAKPIFTQRCGNLS